MISDRTQRRFRDRVTIALESHVAKLQASVRSIAHHERPDYPRPARGAARPGVRARPHVHVAVLDVRLDPAARRHHRAADVDPPGAGAAGGVRAADGVHVHLASGGRTGRGGTRRLCESVSTPPVQYRHDGRRPAKKCASPASANGWSSSDATRGCGGTGRSPPHGPAARCGTRSAGRSSAPATSARWYSCRRVLGGTAGQVLLVLAAGSRLSAYIGATVGEIGFLRGIWLDGSRRLAWLEDYAASLARERRRARCRNG